MSTNLIAIYDFEFFPYALGDVLTWNVRTAMQCEELGKDFVDLYICLDEKYPASIYQRGLVNPDNFHLFFSELYGAFGTNPRLGNIFIFSKREELLVKLQAVSYKDKPNLEIVNDYLMILKHRISDRFLSKVQMKLEKKLRQNKIATRIYNFLFSKPWKEKIASQFSQEYILNQYFIKYIYSHEKINEFYSQKGFIPHLTPSLGCAPDVDEMIVRLFKNKKIVPFHVRLRRLDVGYGGEHSYDRDSDFLEWYHFLREAGSLYPDVQFVALGRLQEKPLEILRLPNVTSLRMFGMGLGHELTLMLKSDLFIGSSSGFAALANFSKLPYFITRMNPGSCHAYAIPENADKLPFSADNQKLIYEKETAELLMDLLKKGLGLKDVCMSAEKVEIASLPINLHQWLELQTHPTHSARTTSRFYHNEKYREEETAYLLLPYLEKARCALLSNQKQEAELILLRLNNNFPELCKQLSPYLCLQKSMASEEKSDALLQSFLVGAL